MFEPMTPTAEQQEAIDEIVAARASGGCLLGAMPGTGKTLMSVEVCKALDAKVILVIAPLQTMGDPTLEREDVGGWMGTFDQQGSTLPFRQIDGTKSGQHAMADYQWMVPGIYFVGQEYFVLQGYDTVPVMIRKGVPKISKKTGKPLTKRVDNGTWSRVQPDVAIFDEVHRAQSADSRTHEVLMYLDAHFKIAASGTPTGNNFDGAYAVTKWVWPFLAEDNIYDWRDKWAETVYDHFAVRNQKTVGEKVEGAYFNSLPCYIRLEADFDFTIDDQIVDVPLSTEQRRVYDELDLQMVAWINDDPMVTKFPMTKRVRQRQATLGMPNITWSVNPKTGDPEFEVGFDNDCESPKIEKSFKILEQDFEFEPTLIFTDSQLFARVLTYRLDQRYGEGSAREWSGKVSRAKRNKDKRDFLDGKYKYFVAVIAAAGTGTDGLQEISRNILYLSASDSRIDNEQSMARLARRGQKEMVVRIRRLHAPDTVDSGQHSKQVEQALRMNRSLKRKARNEQIARATGQVRHW